jgi:hypothetical protein
MQPCEECNGYGEIGLGHMNDPDEKFAECEYCDGTGKRDLEFKDMDGVKVRVIATGFVGMCNLMATGRAIVIDENDVEVCDLTLIELELVE